MTDHDPIAALIETAEGPVPPDHAFATRLRTRLIARLAEPNADALPAAQVVTAVPKPSRSIRRHRWLDIAAAAVLLIGIISGLASLAPNKPSQGPATIHAPETGQPLMSGGTSAQDNQYPGPAPTSSDYERRWKIGTEQDGYTWNALAYGNLLYAVSTAPASVIAAIDLDTGSVIWRHRTLIDAAFAVAPQGVVVYVPVIEPGKPASPERTNSFQIALLDRATGVPIWFSSELYPNLAGTERQHPIVTGDSIYFADAAGTIFALDLATGQERWRHSYDRTLAAGINPQLCFPQVEQEDECYSRTDYWVNVAVSGTTLYFTDMVTARVTALSVADGAERWNVSMVDRAGSRTQHGALIAHQDGVIVQLFAADAELAGGSSYLGLWSAEDGTEVWWNNFDISAGGIASDGAALFVSYRWAGETCCFLSAIDAQTGEFRWTKTLKSDAYVVAYLPSATMILLSVSDPLTATIGIDAVTREEVWRFRHFQNDCAPRFPLAADTALVCWGINSGLNMFQPVPTEATPEAPATPVAERVDTVDPSALDGQTSGRFPPPDATFELLWDDQLTSDDGSFGVSQGWSLQDFWGDSVYGLRFTTNGDVLEARSLQTGDTLWQTPVLPSFPITATSAGVIAALPVEDAGTRSPQPFTLALLDRQNGEVVWQTEREYRQSSELGFKVVVADERSVMFIDESLAVVAIDLADGSERWRFDATRGRTEAEMIGECTPLSLVCGNRPFQSTQIALFGDTLYAYLPIPAEVVALSAQDGNPRWVVSLPERTGQQSSDVRLLATELGVVMLATDQRTRGVIVGNRYFGLWSGADGAERWVSAEFAAPMVRAGSSLFVSLDNPAGTDGPPCCTLRELDLATGAVIGERTMGDLQTLALQYFPASDVLQLYRPNGEGSIIRNFLADENDPIARLLPIPDCQGLMPTPDGNYVLCQRPDLTLAVYRVSMAKATPSS